jgi:hypothetical protein
MKKMPDSTSASIFPRQLQRVTIHKQLNQCIKKTFGITLHGNWGEGGGSKR